ncbi:MAG TPA: ABC transporter permease, partial [Methylotenera sp.]|nr:ABC transporter permease [Methylotenera sp.]
MIKSNLLLNIICTLRAIGKRMIERIWRLGAGARLFFLTIIYSGESFRRFHLTLREIYSTGVMSLMIIIVSAFFVGMVLALQGYNT